MITGVDWAPVWLSLRVAGAALFVVAGAGTLAAWLMAGRHFRGKELLDALLLLPLVLPPIVVGYALLLLLGKRGPMGALKWLFTPQAAVLAAAVVAFPLMYGSAKAAFLSLDRDLLQAARVFGAKPARAFWTIALPLSWPGLVAGIVLSFARALGEFGATILVAGNIEGQTATMPTAIYSAVENGDWRVAGVYSLLLGSANLLFVCALNVWMRRKRRSGF